MLPFFLKGLLLGFSIAAPVGPIGVLCIRRTLAQGRAYGLVSGLGAATADAAYGAVAAFGLTAITTALVNQQFWLALGGGLFLCVLGAKTFVAQPSGQAAHESGRGLLGAFASTLILTLTNPLTILSFVAMFAGLGLGKTVGDYATAGWMVLGVLGGSAAWWLLLTTGVSLLRARFTARALQWVNRISGGIIFGFGVVALWGLV